jgi:hypothetical protein
MIHAHTHQKGGGIRSDQQRSHRESRVAAQSSAESRSLAHPIESADGEKERARERARFLKDPRHRLSNQHPSNQNQNTDRSKQVSIEPPLDPTDGEQPGVRCGSGPIECATYGLDGPGSFGCLHHLPITSHIDRPESGPLPAAYHHAKPLTQPLAKPLPQPLANKAAVPDAHSQTGAWGVGHGC